ncbi:MAG: alpha/beta hydrolase [Phycisphaerae bacterium]|nr:alpha/beta hydrolase [Phycisphaerae bacterium]
MGGDRMTVLSAVTVVLLAACCMASAAQPTVELLWPKGAPGAKGDKAGDKPSLRVYLPDKAKATGCGIVICPGGGYGNLAMDHEGYKVAEWLDSIGVAGFILTYRHSGTGYRHPAPLQDAQRAIRTVRFRAKEWGVDPNRIGIMGFSAGGHLASSAGTHFDKGDKGAADPIDRVSCRPDFMVLGYPVISFTREFTHVGSKNNLLGKDPSKELVELFSNELQVTPETPPTFLVHADDDKGVPPENSVVFYLALKKAKVPAEMHIYLKGDHGFGMRKTGLDSETWTVRCADWMRSMGMLGGK